MTSGEQLSNRLKDLWNWCKEVCTCKKMPEELCKYCKFANDQSAQAYDEHENEYHDIADEFIDHMVMNERLRNEQLKEDLDEDQSVIQSNYNSVN
jgi:hypothetical protein